MVRGQIEANGSLGGSLVRTQTSISIEAWTWHMEDLLVAHTPIARDHHADSHTVLVLGGVQILLERPTL